MNIFPEVVYVFDCWNHEGNANPKHHHDFFEISFLLEGEASYWFQDKWQTIRGGDILLFNPLVDHAEKQLGNSYSHQLHIGIKNFQLPNMEENFLPTNSPHLLLRENQLQIFDKAWQLLKEFNNQPENFQLMGQALVTELLLLLSRTVKQQEIRTRRNSRTTLKNERLSRVVTSIQSYIDNNYANDISLESLASSYYVSPTYLSKAFKEQINISPITYLIQVRLKKAYQLLQEHEYSVKEIAKAVGYEDAYHFSKSFKKVYGIAPSKVKPLVKEKN